MRLGFGTLGDLKWSLERFAEELAQSGYDCIEIRGRKGEHLGPEEGAKRRKEVRRIFEDAGVEIAAITAYTQLVDRAKHAETVETLRQYLQLATDIGAGFVRTFGGNLLEGQDRDDAIAAAAEALGQIAPDAEKHGVAVALETHDGFSHSDMVKEAVGQVGSPFIRVLWDVHHPFRHGEAWSESYANLKDTLGYLHVKDAFLLPDGKEQLCLLGAGRVPVREIVRQLDADGFDGPVVIEWEGAWHPELPACELAIPQHMAKLREYLEA
jgi:sugar phosphate isomerase/epimerase